MGHFRSAIAVACATYQRSAICGSRHSAGDVSWLDLNPRPANNAGYGVVIVDALREREGER